MDFSTNGNEERELYHAQIHLNRHAFNFVSHMALKSAVELGIADAIHNHGKPMTLSELASALNLHPSKVGVLHHFLRLLAHNGFFTKTTVPLQNGKEGEEETTYALTPSSKLLVRGSTLTCLMRMTSRYPKFLDMWNSSKKWLTEDKELSLFESAIGVSFWEYVNNNLNVLSMFQETMAADAQILKLALKECKHVFEGVSSLVDVGGGTSGLTKLIHEVLPHLKCTVLDQPQVVANLTGSEILNFVGGDMFKSIPSADAVLLKRVLHNWNDELSLKILKNCKEAISGKGKEGKVIIIDIVIDEINDDRELTEWKLSDDLMMLALLNGKERERKEWEKLVYDAGFSSYKISTLPYDSKSLIEVYP